LEEGQIAEYLAAKLGAKVSGKEAFISLNEKILFTPRIYRLHKKASLNKNSPVAISEIQTEVQNIHQLEIERPELLAEREEV
jgi:hypothetical protein